MRVSLHLARNAAVLFFAALAYPAHAASEDGDRRISGPFTYENLSVYLIHGRSQQGPVPLTLAEAMQRNLLRVHETGEVGALSIENLSDQEVFVQSGDIVKGGKQDRVLAVSLILGPRSGRLPLDSYCVEAGRWGARSGENVGLFSNASRSVPSLEVLQSVGNVVPQTFPGKQAEMLENPRPGRVDHGFTWSDSRGSRTAAVRASARQPR